MNIDELKKRIDTKIICKKLLYSKELTSTNKILYQKAVQEKLPDGTTLIADVQTEGRGRLDRKWVSPEGNLYISVLLRPDVDPKNTPIFTFLASCALKDTFDLYQVDSVIKWPNDILIKKKKIAGVLTELKFAGDSIDFLIVGIGVNLNMTLDYISDSMPGISNKVTSLGIELEKKINKEEFTASLVNNIESFYQRFLSKGKSEILSEWTSRWNSLGKQVEIKDGEKVYKGVAERVDENGFLYIKTESGKLEKVITGDFVF